MLPAVIVGAALVVASRAIAGPFWGTSYLVLAAATLSAAAIVSTATSEAGGAAWRRRTGAIAAILVAQPALWATVALADHWAPGTRITWALAVLAGTWHLPLIAVFSVLPLLAIADIGARSTRGRVAAVGGSLACAAATFALFFSDFDPFTAEPLLTWEHGEALGAASNLLFLGTVLVGPVSSLLHALRAGSETASMTQIALVSLAGVAIVMLCGALGATTGLGAVTLFVGLDAAVGVTTVGTLRVLAQARAAAREPVVRIGRLSERESEVLGLVASGLTNAGVAERLVVSERTVDAHLRSIFAKLDLPEGPLVNRRVHAALLWSESQHQRTLTPE